MTHFELPPLPYDMNALEPLISSETLSTHYLKHHQGYVSKLNELLPESGFENKSLEEIVRQASGPLFNNAGQHWNHSFYWQCMMPHGSQKPGIRLGEAMDRSFGSFEKWTELFKKTAAEHFGSGWAWLASDNNGKLSVIATHDADSPLRRGLTPLLTVDVWEHAYYIDYRNDRKSYLKKFLELVNWDFAEAMFDRRSENPNLVLDTRGGEMPDPDHKLVEKASDAANVFKKEAKKKAG